MTYKRVFDREEAVFLRKLGMSHIQVSALMGCSLDWSRHVASGVEIDYAMLKRLHELLFVDENSNLLEELSASASK